MKTSQFLRKSFMLFVVNGFLISGITGCTSENVGSEVLDVTDMIEETNNSLQETTKDSVEETAKELFEKSYPVLIGIVYKENFIFNKDKEISLYIDGEKIERLEQGEQSGYGFILSKGIHTIAIANNILNADLKTFMVGEDKILGKGIPNVFLIGAKFKSSSVEITDLVGTNIGSYVSAIEAANDYDIMKDAVLAADFTPVGDYMAVLEKYIELYPEETEDIFWDDDYSDESYEVNNDNHYGDEFWGADLFYGDSSDDECCDENDYVDEMLMSYILPYSDSEYIDESDLEELSAEECRIARNEIYARHGRRFNDEGLQNYFDSCSWYEGTIIPENFSDVVLNEVEKANLQVIAEYEKEMGYQ